ncbi:MAG: hypothetical protein WC491_03620 [Candidatus Omnitrophota bacterium]
MLKCCRRRIAWSHNAIFSISLVYILLTTCFAYSQNNPLSKAVDSVMSDLVKQQIAANEYSAISSLRTIYMACESYRYWNAGEVKPYPPDIKTLSSTNPPFIDATLGAGLKQGYVYAYALLGPDKFTCTASPEKPGDSGGKTFFINESGIIRLNSVNGAEVDYALEQSLKEKSGLYSKEEIENDKGSSGFTNLRTLSTALESYRASTSPPTYPKDLKMLSDVNPPFIDKALGRGEKEGYIFTYTFISANKYTCVASPEQKVVCGYRVYFADETGVIRLNNADGPPAEN